MFDERGGVGQVFALNDGSFTSEGPKWLDYGSGVHAPDQNETRERYAHTTEIFPDGKGYIKPIKAKNWPQALELLLKIK